jgi:hypothetical protein
MLLQEMWQDVPQEYQNTEDDNSQARLGALRKTKLTLAQIRQLRQLNDIRVTEYNEKMGHLKKQYGTPPQEGGGGF